MRSTFHYRQELRSTEFGTLLYDILPSGIYKTPSLSVQGSNIIMTGGTFLLKDNSGGMNFAIRVSYEDNETLESLDSIPDSLPAYIYLVFTYNSTQAVAPSLRVSGTLPVEGEYILLGRILTGNQIDTTSSDLRGPGFSYPNPIISSLNYSNETLDVVFSGYCQNNNTFSVVNNFHQTGVAVSNGYALYIDQNGNPALMSYDAGGSYPSMGRTILAYKTAGANLFTIVRYPNHAEYTADSFYLPSASLSSNESILDNIYADSSTSNAQGAILSKVIQRLVVEVQTLRDEINQAKIDISNLQAMVGGMGDTITVTNLIVTNSANFSGATVNLSNTNINMNNSTLGSRSNPIYDLYVTHVLYADDVRLLTT